MPYLYPVKDGKGQIVVKHLTNFDMINQKILQAQKTENFSIAYLKRSLQDISKSFKVEISGTYFYPRVKKNNYVDHYYIDEAVDFVNLNTKPIPAKSKKNDKNISLKEILEDQHYITLKQRELDIQIMNNSRENLYISGFIHFKSYDEKLKFLNSAPCWFGLNIIKNQFVKFYDADLMNIIQLSDNRFLKQETNYLLKDFNRILGHKNSGIELECSEYTDKTIPRDKIWDKKVWLRFNSFEETYKALHLIITKTNELVKIL
jgi:hypothetical protein